MEIFIISIVMLVVAIIGIKYAFDNNLFDEDVKYLVFDEKDKDKMKPEEFEKAMRINKEQEAKREEILKRKKQ